MFRSCATMILLVAGIASGQATPDTARSIRFSLPFSEDRVHRVILESLIANNMTLTAESPHAIFASPIEWPNVSVRIMMLGSESITQILLSEALSKAGGGSSFQGTGMSFGGQLEAVDRDGGKFWRRLQDFAEALRAVKQ